MIRRLLEHIILSAYTDHSLSNSLYGVRYLFNQLSTNMATENVFTEVGVYSNLSLNMPSPTQDKPCCHSDLHEHNDIKIPTIFDAVKSGFVLTASNVAEQPQ